PYRTSSWAAARRSPVPPAAPNHCTPNWVRSCGITYIWIGPGGSGPMVKSRVTAPWSELQEMLLGAGCATKVAGTARTHTVGGEAVPAIVAWTVPARFSTRLRVAVCPEWTETGLLSEARCAPSAATRTEIGPGGTSVKW